MKTFEFYLKFDQRGQIVFQLDVLFCCNHSKMIVFSEVGANLLNFGKPTIRASYRNRAFSMVSTGCETIASFMKI